MRARPSTVSVAVMLASGLAAGCGHRGVESRSPEAPDEGEKSVEARLPPETIQKIMRDNYDPLRQCYEGGLVRDAGLRGLVALRFVIARSGKVTQVSVDDRTELPDTVAIDCMVSVVADLTFPEPEGGIVTVVYPIRFEPSSD